MTGDDFRDLERRRLRALVDFDPEVADALHANDFQLINPSGMALTRKDYLDGLESGFLRYLTFEPTAGIPVRL